MKEPVQPYNRNFPLPPRGTFTALQVRTVAYAPTASEPEDGVREVVWYSSVEDAAELEPFYGIYGVLDDQTVEHVADRDSLDDALRLVKGLGAWVEPEQVAPVETLLDTPIRPIDIEVARLFLCALGRSPLAYHIDDDPADCIQFTNREPSFSPELAGKLRERVAECMQVLGYPGAWQVYGPPTLVEDAADAADQPLPSVSVVGAKKPGLAR